MAVKSAKFACITASAIYFCRTKEPISANSYKIFCITMTFLMVMSYGVFLYFHNKSYPRVTYDIHKIGERVELGNNYIELFVTFRL